MRRVDSLLARFTFGGRVPGGVGIILAVTLVASLAAAFGSRTWVELFDLGSLVPERVLHGEIWRLLTWSLLETNPIGLLFTCLFLYWFGRDLAKEWGSRRFFLVYFGIALLASSGTCMLALLDGNLRGQHYLGSLALAEAMTVAWGLWFPHRIIRIYFVIPIKGIVLAWGTVALTVAYAVYYGWEHLLPNLLAEGSMLAWLYRAPAVARWRTWQRARVLGERQRQVREKSARRTATVRVLHQLEEHDDDLPPLTPEMEGKLGQILEDAARNHRKKRDD
ncbi:MAG TPA: rhomboid family intramembrane serine protease [Labilithrix sp.]|nr:rhomboid family intramembrane serine protease [Labilithrix sp.]